MKHKKKIYNLIYKYIDDHFGDLRLEKVYHCYYYFSDKKGRVIFRYFDKCYWEGVNSRNIEISPVIDFIEEYEYDVINGYFGNLWIPIFKDWFKNTHDLELKTISDETL
jgi:hypothetical protein